MILIFYILYFLQINFFSWFNIAGVKPNLFIILVLIIGLFVGKKVAIPFGFFCGIYLDMLTGKQLGISALAFAGIGLLGEYFDKTFSKDSKITILLMVAGCTLLYEIVIYFYTIARNAIPLQLVGFFKILIIEVVFNILLTIIIYPIIKTSGYYLERTFKTKKILTRYF